MNNVHRIFNLIQLCENIMMHCTDQAPLSYALPNEEPAGHLNADDHIYGSLERENKSFSHLWQSERENKFPPSLIPNS